MGNDWRKSYEVESWLEFKDLIGRAITEKTWGTELDHYWFRGHAAAHWPLRSSFDRLFNGLNPAQRKNIHQTMIDGLRERLDQSEDDRILATRDRLRELSNDVAELAALAQHYGSPTRMLDWSESPYVAAYFAFADLVQGGLDTADIDGQGEDACCIFALNTLASAWNSDSGVSLVVTDRRLNTRLRHQRGVFTLNSSMASTLEKYCEEFYRTNASPEPALIKISIPRLEARHAIRDLEMMGITSESMFPGLEGAARYAFVRAIDQHVWRTPT